MTKGMGEGMTPDERQEMVTGFNTVGGKIDVLTKIVHELSTQFAVLDAYLFGKNKENGISGQTKRNSEEIGKLDNRVDCIEKQIIQFPDGKQGGDIEKTKIEWEGRLKIEKARARRNLLIAFFGSGGFLLTIIFWVLQALKVIKI